MKLPDGAHSDVNLKSIGQMVYDTQQAIDYAKATLEALKLQIVERGPAPHPTKENHYYGIWEYEKSIINNKEKAYEILFNSLGDELFFKSIGSPAIALYKRVDKEHKKETYKTLEKEKLITTETAKKFSWKEID